MLACTYTQDFFQDVDSGANHTGALAHTCQEPQTLTETQHKDEAAAAAAAADLIGKAAQPLVFASLSQVELHDTTGSHDCNGDGG